ncbi:MAG: LamG domain-containing protein [Chitinophagaceae bacterium]|nr:MAG: LamG domain-containing protein [Chitinophagaceae bacterium]
MSMKYSIYLLAGAMLGIAALGCKKTGSDSGMEVNANAPSITTADAINVTSTNATVGGNVSSDNGASLQEVGIVYSTSAGVDTSKTRVRMYTAGGNFSTQLKNLSLLTTYYYRAYAINEKGLTYGAEKSFFVPVNGYSASSQVAAANLVAHWAFENGYVDSVSKVAGTPVNTAAISFVTGKKGQAVQVKSPGYINSNITNTIANLGSITVACWIQQPTSLASAPTTFMPFSLNKAGYSWEQTKFFMLFDSPDNTANSYGKVCIMDQWFDKGKVWPRMLDASWHQMVITFDGASGALRVYVDGTLLPQSSAHSFTPQTNFGPADSFTLGGPDANANTINGWMNSLSGNLDEFRVYSKALTTDEVMALYALQNKGF